VVVVVNREDIDRGTDGSERVSHEFKLRTAALGSLGEPIRGLPTEVVRDAQCESHTRRFSWKRCYATDGERCSRHR
jgi:hypothetical protein